MQAWFLLLAALLQVQQCVCFRPAASGLQRGRAQSSLKGLLESFGQWLLPIKEVPPPQMPTEDEKRYYKAFLFDDDITDAERDSMRAKSIDEWLDAPVFGPGMKLQVDPKLIWDGTRPPIPNLARFDDAAKMEATYGRGKYRTEVWDMVINPANEWWKSFEPSDEEAAAMCQGYYGTKPEDFFQAKGINWEDAKAAFERDLDTARAKYQADKERYEKPITNNEAAQMRWLVSRYNEQEFRFKDDKLQQIKGQPSLSAEDTGARFKNDVK